MELSPINIRCRPAKGESLCSPLIRQWQLLERLAAEKKGITIVEAAEAFGVDTKTIRRDLGVLERLGFDLVGVSEDNGRKRWRLRSAFKRMQTRRQRYRTIGVLWDEAGKQAKALGDWRLEEDLEAIRKRVVRV